MLGSPDPNYAPPPPPSRCFFQLKTQAQTFQRQRDLCVEGMSRFVCESDRGAFNAFVTRLSQVVHNGPSLDAAVGALAHASASHSPAPTTPGWGTSVLPKHHALAVGPETTSQGTQTDSGRSSLRRAGADAVADGDVHAHGGEGGEGGAARPRGHHRVARRRPVIRRRAAPARTVQDEVDVDLDDDSSPSMHRRAPAHELRQEGGVDPWLAQRHLQHGPSDVSVGAAVPSPQHRHHVQQQGQHPHLHQHQRQHHAEHQQHQQRWHQRDVEAHADVYQQYIVRPGDGENDGFVSSYSLGRDSHGSGRGQRGYGRGLGTGEASYDDSEGRTTDATSGDDDDGAVNGHEVDVDLPDDSDGNGDLYAAVVSGDQASHAAVRSGWTSGPDPVQLASQLLNRPAADIRSALQSVATGSDPSSTSPSSGALLGDGGANKSALLERLRGMEDFERAIDHGSRVW